MDFEENLDLLFARKRLCIKTKQEDNILKKFKVILKGKVFLVHAKELFAWTPTFLDSKKSEYNSDNESFHGEEYKHVGSQDGVHDLDDDSDVEGAAPDSSSSFSHPLGFTPVALDSRQENIQTGDKHKHGSDKVNSSPVNARVMSNSQVVHDNVTSKGESTLHSTHNSQTRATFSKTISMGLYFDFDCSLEWGNFSDEILFKRMEMVQQLHDVKQMEAKDNSQKSKIEWAIEGDENSKFFHGIINKKRSQISIRRMFVNGDWKTDPSAVKDAFKDHFPERFKQHINGRIKLNIPFNNRLSTEQVVDLDRGVSRDEIRSAFWNCGENKSSGPDGYTFEFFRRYWRFVGPDFCFVVECFFDNGSFSMGSNSSFIALIPKVIDFRPISLIRCVYKVIRKILASRLATVISDLVFDTQSAFVANRWIRDTFSSAIGSILVNGSPTSEFPFFCGLKQGDPLAPFLFILVMESLHISFSRAINDGFFKGIQIDGTTSISHLFYVDDVVLIGEWSDSNMQSIVTILKCFFLASGLKINIQKSQVLGIGVPRTLVTQAASLIGYALMQRPFRYLGVMIEMDKEISVASKLGSTSLEVSFRRPVHDGVERQQLIDLNLLTGSILLSSSKDRWICNLSGDGEFRVKVARTKLDDFFLPSDSIDTRWVKYIPIKINVFAFQKISKK
nr:RNA-directed DNA polymerase, eukaryota [Tanacetum cinerariifolium]